MVMPTRTSASSREGRAVRTQQRVEMHLDDGARPPAASDEALDVLSANGAARRNTSAKNSWISPAQIAQQRGRRQRHRCRPTAPSAAVRCVAAVLGRRDEHPTTHHERRYRQEPARVSAGDERLAGQRRPARTRSSVSMTLNGDQYEECAPVVSATSCCTRFELVEHDRRRARVRTARTAARRHGGSAGDRVRRPESAPRPRQARRTGSCRPGEAVARPVMSCDHRDEDADEGRRRPGSALSERADRDEADRGERTQSGGHRGCSLIASRSLSSNDS